MEIGKYTTDDVDYNIVAEPEVAQQINTELNLARRIIEQTGANLFLTGKAGTGKTTFLRNLKETTRKRMVVLAPTGVAAINAQGMTIHSFFQLPFSPFIPGKGFIGEKKRNFNFSKTKRKMLRGLDLLVIDEISMVRPDLLDAVDDMLRRYRDPSRPFGGVQLLLIGDLRQLAPVVKSSEEQFLRPYYASPYFFESTALKRAGFLTVELRTVYRQSDRQFIDLLNSVREGRDVWNALTLLNNRCIPQPKDEAWQNAIRLTSHNAIADSVNARKLAELTTTEVSFESSVEGKFPESSFPAEKLLVLKEGARVMFIKNDTGGARRYYNGMLGTVVAIGESTVTVRADESGVLIETGKETWLNTRYEVNEQTNDFDEVVDGSFSQIPLRLAWAITIHKSQGLTFDKAIIEASRAFAPGQLYVALSRCRTLDGMILDSKLPPSAVMIDRVVDEFVDADEHHTPSAAVVDRYCDDYFRNSLAELFDFSGLRIKFQDLSRAVQDYVAPMRHELFRTFTAAERTFDKDIEAVGKKFIALYATPALTKNSIVAGGLMDAKIKGGCKYFAEKLRKIANLVLTTDMKVDNKGYQSRLDNAREAFLFDVITSVKVLDRLAEVTFTPAELVDIRSRSSMEVANLVFNADNVAETIAPAGSKSVATTAAAKPAPKPVAKPEAKGGVGNQNLKNVKKSKKEQKAKKPKGYSEHESLKMFRACKSVEQIAAERNLAESTVAGHLSRFISSGVISAELLLGPNHAFLMGIINSTPDITINQLREQVADRAKPWQITVLYNIVKERNSTNITQ